MNKSAASTIMKHVFLVFIFITMLGPFIWMLSVAFKEFGDVFTYPPAIIPPSVRWQNFPDVFAAFPFARFIFNSGIVTILRVIGTIITSTMAGYAFARLEFPGRDSIFLLYLATLMVPFQVVMIPLFIIMRHLGWVDSYQALIVPGIFQAFGTFLCRQFFLTIPKSLEESAFIDGASFWTIFVRIIMPLVKPAVATLSVLTFLWSWNDFLWPLIVIDSLKLNTLTLGIASFQGQYYTQWNLLMAGVTISIIPTVVVYLLAQKWFVEGIAMSGVKY